jgi:hypothetical protein
MVHQPIICMHAHVALQRAAVFVCHDLVHSFSCSPIQCHFLILEPGAFLISILRAPNCYCCSACRVEALPASANLTTSLWTTDDLDMYAISARRLLHDVLLYSLPKTPSLPCAVTRAQHSPTHTLSLKQGRSIRGSKPHWAMSGDGRSDPCRWVACGPERRSR